MINIVKYRDWLVMYRNVKPRTVGEYVSYMKKFIREVSEDFTQASVEACFRNLMEAGASATLINQWLKAFRSYNKFCVETGALESELKIPKDRHVILKSPAYISLDQFEDEFVETIDCVFKNALQVKVILYVLFYTGMRAGSLCESKRSDFDIKNRTILIHYEKGRQKQYPIPMHKKLVPLLDLYFSITKEGKNAFNTSRPKLNYIFRRLRPYFKDQKIFVHMFRSSCCVHLSKCGVPFTIIKAIMGHKNAATTERYTRLNQQDTLDIYQSKVK